MITEFDILISNLIILYNDDRLIQQKIEENSIDIKHCVKEKIEISRDIKLPDITNKLLPILEKTQTNGSNIEESEDNEENSSDKIIPSIVTKKLYKYIAMNTHPDKTTNIEWNRLFVIANEASKKDDSLSLLYIFWKCCKEYTDILDTDDIIQLNTKLNNMRNGVIKKRNSITFNWNILNNNVKNKILSKYCKC